MILNGPETQGERIRRARDERGLKQGYVARTAGITQAHLSRIENDESGVTDHTLKKLAAAIGLPFDDIVVRKDPRKDDGPRINNIEDVIASDAALVRFMGGERPDPETFDWVRRSLMVIRSEVKRRREF
jgi:transcriptional regulator with XRE-family HTH domain